MVHIKLNIDSYVKKFNKKYGRKFLDMVYLPVCIYAGSYISYLKLFNTGRLSTLKPLNNILLFIMLYYYKYVFGELVFSKL